MCVNIRCAPVEIRRFSVALIWWGLLGISCVCTALGVVSRLLWFVLARIVREWQTIKRSSCIPCTSLLQGVWQAGPGGLGPKCSSWNPGVAHRNRRKGYKKHDALVLHCCSLCCSKPSHWQQKGWYFFLEIRISLCLVLLSWAIWKVL